MIKISVIIPVFNVENFLNKCLDSILNQTLNDIEVICVNDGSDDSSLDILREYESKDNRVVVITQENSGAASCRNKGIDIAQGEYIYFIDADDWLELDALEKLYDNAKSNNSDMVLFNAVEHYPDNVTKNRIYSPLNSNEIDFNNFTFDYKYKKRLVLNGFFVIWTKIYKTSFLRQNNIRFYNHRIFNDMQFHVETMILAKRMSYLPEILYNYNKLNETSIQTKKTTYNKRLLIFDIFDGIESFLINENKWDEFKLEFYEFKLLQSKVNLDRTSDNFKDEFYDKMRNEFIHMDISSEILKKLPFKFYELYVHVLNNNSLFKFKRYRFFLNYDIKFINKKEFTEKLENFNGLGVNRDERKEHIIVSLTSFPQRMHDIHYCLYSLLNQTFKPDEIILWLAHEEFPNKEKDIPKEVLKLKNNGLTIKWCDNLKSYKKLIPALKQYPKSFIVTADDDIFYSKDWLKGMWDTYKQYPNNIVAVRVKRIKFDSRNNEISKYNDWQMQYGVSTSYLNFFTGAGGVLYFPNSLSDKVLNEDMFLKLCPSADDIWFWAMAILNKTKITSFNDDSYDLTYVNVLREINVNDEMTLFENNKLGQNDIQLSNVLKEFPEILDLIRSEC